MGKEFHNNRLRGNCKKQNITETLRYSKNKDRVYLDNRHSTQLPVLFVFVIALKHFIKSPRTSERYRTNNSSH